MCAATPSTPNNLFAISQNLQQICRVYEKPKNTPTKKKEKKKREFFFQFYYYYYYYCILPRKRPATKSKIEEEMVEDRRGRSSCYYIHRNTPRHVLCSGRRSRRRGREKRANECRKLGEKTSKKNIQ
jgi:hypothetical protein